MTSVDSWRRGAPRPLGRRVLLGIVLGLASIVGFVWLFALWVMDPGPHIAVLDGLHLPPSWELVRTNVVPQIIMGSRVERYYLVDADPGEVVAPVTSALTEAGFVLDVTKAPRDWCDTRPLRATPVFVCPEKLIPACSENGPGGPTTCYLSATRGQECLAVVAYDRGVPAGYVGGVVRDPGGSRIVVRITDHYGGGLTCPGLR
jgi:hypothetical protein